MSDQESGTRGSVNFPQPTVDGRQSNGTFTDYRRGTKVRVAASNDIKPGDTIYAVVYGKDPGRTRFEIGRQTVSSMPCVIDVAGSRLVEIRNTSVDWDFFIAVNRGTTNVGYSPTMPLNLKNALKDGSEADSEADSDASP